jgi:hypothetical protein
MTFISTFDFPNPAPFPCCDGEGQAEHPNSNWLAHPLSNLQHMEAGGHDAEEEGPAQATAAVLVVAGSNGTGPSLEKWAERQTVAHNGDLRKESG